MKIEGLNSLSPLANTARPETIDPADQVEQLFARMLLKEVRASAPELWSSPPMEMFGDLFDEVIAKQLANQLDLGLGSSPSRTGAGLKFPPLDPKE